MYVCFMRFSTIFTVRSLKSLFELLRSLLLKLLKSGPLRARFCQFAQSAPLFASRSAIALKIKVRSRAISKSDMPSSDFLWLLIVLYLHTYVYAGSDRHVLTEANPPALVAGLRSGGAVCAGISATLDSGPRVSRGSR